MENQISNKQPSNEELIEYVHKQYNEMEDVDTIDEFHSGIICGYQQCLDDILNFLKHGENI